MQDQGPERSKPLLLYLVSEDWYFRSHRQPMAQAAQQMAMIQQGADAAQKLGGIDTSRQSALTDATQAFAGYS